MTEQTYNPNYLRNPIDVEMERLEIVRAARSIFKLLDALPESEYQMTSTLIGSIRINTQSFLDSVTGNDHSDQPDLFDQA